MLCLYSNFKLNNMRKTSQSLLIFCTICVKHGCVAEKISSAKAMTLLLREGDFLILFIATNQVAAMATSCKATPSSSAHVRHMCNSDSTVFIYYGIYTIQDWLELPNRFRIGSLVTILVLLSPRMVWDTQNFSSEVNDFDFTAMFL